MSGDTPQGDRFGRVADTYARYRPSYPPDLFATLADAAGEEARTVLDVASGTGAGARGLLDAGYHVVAIEPDLSMLRRARASLDESDRFVGAVAARAERLPLREGAADLVTVAQAFHWFEEGEALDAFADVLAPGGILGVFWNVVERDAFVGAVRALIHRSVDDVEIPVTAAMREPPPALVDHEAFGFVTTAEFSHEREMTADRYVNYAFSWSYCGGSLAADEREPFERELRALIDRHHGVEPWRERLVAILHVARRREAGSAHAE